MITKLHVQNFKCLRDVSVELRPFTVLIGKNDTGKSSLLEAIHTLSWLLGGPQGPERPTSVIELVSRGAEPAFISWDVEFAASPRNGLPGAAHYSLRLAVGPGNVRRVDGEALSVDRVDERETALPEPSGHRDTPTLALISQRDSPRIPSAVLTELRGAVEYAFETAKLVEPAPLAHVPVLRRDGAGLASVLDYLNGTDRDSFDQIEHELHAAVPAIKRIRLRPSTVNGAQQPSGKALYFELSADGQQIPAAYVSDGAMLFLAYLSLVHSTTHASTILIEEPENGIHPRQLQRVAEYLKRLTDPARGKDAVQIVTATHSPYFLDFVPPEDVLVFGRKDNGETVVRPLISLPGVKERLASGFSLGEMWFNVGEDRLLAEALA
jgi:predicted ATPase